MNDITKDQALLIKSLEDYKTVTGAMRFKRTKEEMASGWSPEEALQRRVAAALGEDVPDSVRRGVAQAKAGQFVEGPDLAAAKKLATRLSSRKGDFAIQVRPAAKTDVDYFGQVPTEPIEIELDQSWYSWFDTLARGPFQGDTTKLLRFILEQGIGEVLTKIHFAEDIIEHERSVRTPEEVT